MLNDVVVRMHPLALLLWLWGSAIITMSDNCYLEVKESFECLENSGHEYC